MRNTKLSLLLSILFFLGCDRGNGKFDSKKIDLIESKVWNLDLVNSFNGRIPTEIPSLYIAKFNHIPIFFMNDELLWGDIDHSGGVYSFKQDTLLITSSFIKPDFHSSIHETDTVFIGRITFINKDSLVILRLKDRLFSPLFGEVDNYRYLRFYNDSLITKNETFFKTISLSSGLCFGNCSKHAIELDGSGNLHYFVEADSIENAFYFGKTNIETLDTIRHFLSAAILNRDAFNLYGTPEDAPGTEIKIVLQNNDSITIDGWASRFNYRLWQIYLKLNSIIRLDNLEKDTTEYRFLSTKYLK